MFFILGLFISTAFFGIICLLISIFAIHLDVSVLLQIALHPYGFKEFFLAYMFWSPVAYIVLEIIYYLGLKTSHKKRGDEYHLSQFLLLAIKQFKGNITQPFEGLVTLIGASKVINGDEECTGLFWIYCWFEVILHFLWSVALLGFIGLGFYCLIR